MTAISLIGAATTIEAKHLRRIVTHCHPCRDEDGSHRFGAMSGVRLEFSGRDVIGIATDGRVMVIAEGYHCPISPLEEPGVCDIDMTKSSTFDNCTVDMTKLYAVRASLNTHSNLVVTSFRSDGAMFQWTNNAGKSKEKSFEILCPFVDGRYPNWHQVVPEVSDYDCITAFDAGDWVEAWEKSQEYPGHEVRFGHAPNGKITAKRVPHVVSLPVTRSESTSNNHMNLDVNLNMRDFVIPFLKRCSGPVELLSNGPHSPVVLRIPYVRAIVMPIARSD